MANPQKPKSSDEQEIQTQIKTQGDNDTVDRNKDGKIVAEQPAPGKEVPDSAVVVRQYAKWTDNNGVFHKVPLDGTTAIRQPAHEQQELTVEDRDNLDQALALKTPRRDNEEANKALGIFQKAEVRNDRVNQALASEQPVPSEAPKEGPVEGPDDVNVVPKPGRVSGNSDA